MRSFFLSPTNINFSMCLPYGHITPPMKLTNVTIAKIFYHTADCYSITSFPQSRRFPCSASVHGGNETSAGKHTDTPTGGADMLSPKRTGGKAALYGGGFPFGRLPPTAAKPATAATAVMA